MTDVADVYAVSAPRRRVPSARGIHQRYNGTMHISARVDYAMRALTELALSAAEDPDRLIKSEYLCHSHEIPTKFLENILRTLRKADIVVSQRGAEGGFRLARDASEITVAQIIRALDGPLVAVRGEAPEVLGYDGSAAHIREVWVATRAAVREVLEGITLAQVVSGAFPDRVVSLLASPEAWHRR